MKRIILCLCLLLVVSQGRVINSYKPRIVNGEDAKVGEIPFQVSLQVRGDHYCGGSIVNENYVVTAAHCVQVDIERPSDISVIAGTLEVKKPLQERHVIQIINYKKYSFFESVPRNDIALIKVDSPFIFSPLVQPVPLPEPHAYIAANSSAVVSGWGSLGGENGGNPDRLQKAQILIVDQEYCQNALMNENRVIFPSQICAYDPSTRRGQCGGDSGGPLIVDGKLIGIVSWSIKDPYCASTVYPGVYARVPEFVDWIIENAF